MNISIINKFVSFFERCFLSAEKYARRRGVTIGNGCLIATRMWGSEPYLITIGNNVQVTADVAFFTHGGGSVLRKFDPTFDMFGKIVIEDNAYIGSRSIILPGVVVGEGSLVAAGSVVTKSVPSGVVVAGNPAKIVCSVKEFYERNIKYNVGTKNMPPASKYQYLMSLPNDKFIVKGYLEY